MGYIKEKHKKLSKHVIKYAEEARKIFKHLIQLHEERVGLFGNSIINEDSLREKLLKNIHREIILIRVIDRDLKKEGISAHKLIEELNANDVNKHVKPYFNYLDQCYKVLDKNLDILHDKWKAYKEIEKRLEKKKKVTIEEIKTTVEKFHHEEIKMFQRISNSIDYEHILEIEKKISKAQQKLKKKPQLHIIIGMSTGAIISLLLGFGSDTSVPEALGSTETLSAIDYSGLSLICTALGGIVGFFKTIKEMNTKEYKLLHQEEKNTHHH